MLLRVYVLAGDLEILVIVEPYSHVLSHLEGCLFASKHGAGTFTDTYGVANSISVHAKDILTLDKQLVVRYQTGADVDDIYALENLFCAFNGFEIIALGYDSSCYGCPFFVGYGFNQRISSHDGDAEAAYPVGLNRESTLSRHGFDDGLDVGTSLHSLIGCQITDIACTYC